MTPPTVMSLLRDEFPDADEEGFLFAEKVLFECEQRTRETGRLDWPYLLEAGTQIRERLTQEQSAHLHLSAEMVNFFTTEIRNEVEGGTSPSTLFSAADSLAQAPVDVIASWFNLDNAYEEVVGQLAKFAWLLVQHDPRTTLDDLLGLDWEQSRQRVATEKGLPR